MPITSDGKLVLAQKKPLLIDWLRNRGIELFSSGENFVTNRCPIDNHKQGHRPVSIDVSKQIWYCNDHKVGGDIFNWEAEEKKIPIGQAIQSLNGENVPPTRQFVCAYEYTDETGKILFTKDRFKIPPPKRKTFELRQPNGTRNIKGVRRVLYHLPAIIEAQMVIDVEGEKDADNLAALGFITTTNFEGAGKWRAEYSEALRGKDVILIGDNDDDGRKHVKNLIPLLAGFVRSLRQAQLPEQFKDVSDYITSLPICDRRLAIEELIDQAKELTSSPSAERFEFSDLMSFDSAHDPNCLVGNRYLVRGGACLWAGGSGYGKSSLELQLAVYWACGVACFGLRPVRPLKSLIIQAENDLGDMGEQLQGVIAGIEAAGDIDVRIRPELVEKNLRIYRAIGQSGTAFLALLDWLIESERPDFVWIDPLFAFAGVDLMNAAATGRFIRDGLFAIAARRLVALNVIHHVGKPVRDPASKAAASSMAEIDFQYLGFGTSEVQNAFRAVNILVPVGNTGKFRLVLSKRGERAGAKDCEGQWARSIYLEHSKKGICWLQCEKPEAKGGRPKDDEQTPEEILFEMASKAWSTNDLFKHMKKETGMKERTFHRRWKELKISNQVSRDSENKWTVNRELPKPLS